MVSLILQILEVSFVTAEEPGSRPDADPVTGAGPKGAQASLCLQRVRLLPCPANETKVSA